MHCKQLLLGFVLSCLGVLMAVGAAPTTQSACEKNLKIIGTACIMYSTDNKGYLPGDLGTLAAEKYIKPEIALCDNSVKKAPKVEAGEELAKWVNDNSDFVFIGGGVKQGKVRNPSETAMVYDKNHEAGASVCFFDGHVEWVEKGKLEELLKQSKENLTK